MTARTLDDEDAACTCGMRGRPIEDHPGDCGIYTRGWRDDEGSAHQVTARREGDAALAEILAPHVPYNALAELMEAIFRSEALIPRQVHHDRIAYEIGHANRKADELRAARLEISRLRSQLDLAARDRGATVLALAVEAMRTLPTSSRGWRLAHLIERVLSSAQTFEYVDGELFAVTATREAADVQP